MRYLILSFLLLLLTEILPAQTFRVSMVKDGDGCEGSTVEMVAFVTGGGSQGFTYEWKKVGIIHDKTVGQGYILTLDKITVADSGRYYCIVTDLSDTTVVWSDTATVAANQLVVNLPQNLSTMEDETVKITATGADGRELPSSRLKWFPSGSGNPLNYRAGSSDIKIRVKYTEGECSGMDSTQIFVKPSVNYYGLFDDGFSRVSLAFRVTVEGPVQFCDSEPLTFKAAADCDAGEDNYTFSWYKLSGIHSRLVGQGAVYKIPSARAVDEGRYYCSVRDVNGFTVVSDTLLLAYEPIPIVLDDFLYGIEGEELLAEARDTLGNLLSKDSLTWYKRSGGVLWTKLGGVMNPCKFTSGNKDMEIKAVFTNWKKCTAIDSLPVYIRASANFLGGGDDGFAQGGSDFIVTVDPPLQREFCENDRIVLNAHVDGATEGYTFRWWKVGSPSNSIVGELAEFEIPKALVSDAGYYYCTARDGNGFTAKSDTVLLVPRQINLPEALYASAYETDLAVTVLDGKNDTVRGSMKWEKRLVGSWIPLSVSGTNPYYFNAPDRNMTIRVSYDYGSCLATDTMPVYIKVYENSGSGEGDGYARTLLPPIIRQNIPFKQYCTTDDSISLAIVAEGSDIRYEWQMLSGSEFMRVALNGASGVNDPCLTMTGLRAGQTGEFSGVFRCKVSCGDIVLYSDTTKVFANHQLSMKVDKDTMALYNGVAGKAEVALVNGAMPWQYTYKSPFGQAYGSDSLRVKTDSIVIDIPGVYRFVSLRDSLGCEVTEDLPSIMVTSPEIPKVKIELLSNAEICPGGDVYLRVTVRDGVGPWKVWLKTQVDGVFSDLDVPGLTMPLEIGKDENGKKNVNLTTDKNAIYLVDSIVDLNGGHGEWAGVVEGSGVEVRILDADPVQFARLSDNHIGMCDPVDLFDKLKPHIEGRLLTTGMFKANGQEVTPRNWMPINAIPYTLTYIYKNDQGCPTTLEVELVADALPAALLTLPENLCEGEEIQLQITLNGTDFRFDLEQERISRGAKSTVTKRLVSSGEDREWFEDVYFLQEDSCLVYRLANLQDKHGCSTIQANQNARIYYHETPDIRMEFRTPDDAGQAWQSLTDTIWTFKEAVGLKTTLTSGVIPWDLKIETTAMSRSARRSGFLLLANGLTPQEKQNTVTEEGDYRCYVSDRYCRREEPVEFAVRYQQPAYLRLKLFLEGMSTEKENITIELRKGVSVQDAAENGEIVGTAKCIVSSDGTVTDQQGGSTIRLSDYGVKGKTESLYVVIRHPGYLPVMSAKAYLITDNKNKASFIDFSNGVNVYTTGGEVIDHMTKIDERDGNIVWALSAVDTQGNKLISVRDGNTLQQTKGRVVNWDMTRKNRDKHSKVK